MVSRTGTVLLVDDDPMQHLRLRAALDRHEVLEARNRHQALGLLRRHMPPVVLLDLDLGRRSGQKGEQGWALLESILETAPQTKVVVMTGQTDDNLQLRAVGHGACDFHRKPIQVEAFRTTVDRVLRRPMAGHNAAVSVANEPTLPGVIGTSPAIAKVCRAIARVAPADVSVVLTGESGTGKEVMARALHAASTRRGEPFVAINCAAIPETLLESELFGYERGAFTGAVKQTLGKIEHAHRGTLFLDEIGDLPMSLQGKLLRFLQERVLERIGGRKEIAVDVRVVCATHRELRKLLEQGTFREDLYYRLAEITVHIPPLRERAGDAVLMARHFLAQYGFSANRGRKMFTAEALQAVDCFHWPGNVRELQNRVKRAVIMAEGPGITAEDLDLSPSPEQPWDLDLRSRRDDVERMILHRALARADGNLSMAARMVGVSRPTLYDLLRQHGLRT
jgi:two-component system NtrC family response regulator